jgi:hypothetical protein
MDSNTSYDKIKHLVEIEDDIFAVFSINSKGETYGLTIAKNIDLIIVLLKIYLLILTRCLSKMIK